MIKCLNVACRQHFTTVEQPIEMNVLLLESSLKCFGNNKCLFMPMKLFEFKILNVSKSLSIFHQTLHEQFNKPNYHIIIFI